MDRWIGQREGDEVGRSDEFRLFWWESIHTSLDITILSCGSMFPPLPCRISWTRPRPPLSPFTSQRNTPSPLFFCIIDAAPLPSLRSLPHGFKRPVPLFLQDFFFPFFFSLSHSLDVVVSLCPNLLFLFPVSTAVRFRTDECAFDFFFSYSVMTMLSYSISPQYERKPQYSQSEIQDGLEVNTIRDFPF
jgi:hypothetical protein